MELNNALLIADVAHARMRPAKNAFKYRVYYLSFALRNLQAMTRMALFSLDRFNLFSFRTEDYAANREPEIWMRAKLAEWGVTEANGDIVLLTMPRVIGHVFNPVSFWFCLDNDQQPRAILANVSNTFGERHAYLLFHDDQRAIGPDDWLTSTKTFHVSPFIDVHGHYEFRFAYGPEKIGVWINHYDDEGLLLTTSLVGKRHPLTSVALLGCFFRYPLVTLKVVGLIHYQALKLFLKGVKYNVKPTPPTAEISR